MVNLDVYKIWYEANNFGSKDPHRDNANHK